MADLLAIETGKAPAVGGQEFQAAGRGLLEAVPFVGEKMAEKAELPQPTTFTERLTRRAARNLPYALAAGPFTGGIPAAIGYVGSVGLGQLAEEAGVPEAYQPVAEVVGGGLPQFGRAVAGRTLGYIEPGLESLYKRAKTKYELGPEARATGGMRYGAGPTPAKASRNLEEFTKEATKRAGSSTSKVDANWIKKTGEDLGKEVEKIFAGRTFQTTPEANQKLDQIVRQAEGIFAQQGNVAKTILEKNIGGQRPQGQLLSPQFAAEDLRGAIEQVNVALNGAKGPQAGILHDLKTVLEEVAEANLSGQAAQAYRNWKFKYSSFATLRDAIQREGASGITPQGYVNPKGLLDVITDRTGGNATRNPLFEDLAEFGDIMKYKEGTRPGVIESAIRTVTESPAAKALGTTLQPRIPTRAGERAATAQTLAPLTQYTQTQE